MKQLALAQVCVVYAIAFALAWAFPAGSEAAGAAAGSTDPPFVTVGSQFGTLRARTRAGDVDWSPGHHRATLILHLNPGCGGCELVLGTWRELATAQAALVESGVPVDLVFSTQATYAGARAYLDERGFASEVVEYLLEKDAEGFWPADAVRFFSTPQTILVDGHGQVIKNQVGAWDADLVAEWVDAIYSSVANDPHH